jgi:cyclophilin family peptidyl-prolyl cis-trans isomerase
MENQNPLPPPPEPKKSKRKLAIALAIIACVLAAVIIVTYVMTADPYTNSIHVLLKTSMGDITVALRNDMPITTGNFRNLVTQKAYDGTTFHRVIEGFMIQSGQLANGSNIPSIQDEFTSTNHNYNGTIAMAKTTAPNSASSQFFINTADNNNITYHDGTKFDDTYVAFGKVISGMDVAMAISHVPTDSSEKPLHEVTLISVTVLT